VLTEERARRIRVVEERDGVILLCPFAGRQPYELLAAPVSCEDDPFTSPRLAEALALSAEGIRRLRVAEGPVALNLWLHAGGHWHIEVLPRFGILAGIELGSGYFVNTMAPESAAGVLRES
jgi:UDPglucose--hexose-1-phosphate uridylyltransferase